MGHDTVEIVPHVCGSNPNRLDSTLGEPCIPLLIPLRAITKFMRQAIHLDGHCGLVAEEVEIIGAVFMLLPKSEAVRSLHERVP